MIPLQGAGGAKRGLIGVEEDLKNRSTEFGIRRRDDVGGRSRVRFLELNLIMCCESCLDKPEWSVESIGAVTPVPEIGSATEISGSSRVSILRTGSSQTPHRPLIARRPSLVISSSVSTISVFVRHFTQ